MSGGAELDGGLGSSGRGGVQASVDLNDFSFNSKMSGMFFAEFDQQLLGHICSLLLLFPSSDRRFKSTKTMRCSRHSQI